MIVDKISNDKMTVDNVAVAKITFSNMFVDEITKDKNMMFRWNDYRQDVVT